MGKRLMRPICLACVSFDVENVVDREPEQAEFFACFDCQDVFYFLADARPRARQLGAFELYAAGGDRKRAA